MVRGGCYFSPSRPHHLHLAGPLWKCLRKNGLPQAWAQLQVGWSHQMRLTELLSQSLFPCPQDGGSGEGSKNKEVQWVQGKGPGAPGRSGGGMGLLLIILVLVCLSPSSSSSPSSCFFTTNNPSHCLRRLPVWLRAYATSSRCWDVCGSMFMVAGVLRRTSSCL